MSRQLRTAVLAAALVVTLAACGHSSSMDSHGSMPGMPGMSHGSAPATPGADGTGLTAEQGGYRLDSTSTELPATASEYRFTVTGPDGRPVTGFTVEQTRQLHFYAVRSDLTGFQHLHPTMAPDGTWTAPLAALTPGSWRLYATFTPADGPGRGTGFVLSRTLTVPGAAVTTALPAPSGTATVDGYTVTVQADLMAGMAHPLTVTVSKDGQPVTDLEPYLDTYAHLTAFHAGDGAFAHLHPQVGATAGGHGGPSLPFHAELAQPGDWRLFLQFQTGGHLHTAALTLRVG